jgi:hypothetical protein
LGADPKQVEPTSKRQAKKRLTFDPLILCLEGLARVLSRLSLAENRGLLLLEGLAQVLVRDAKLGQLPVEPRDLFVPLLEGRLRPLECGTLLLESPLGLFPRQALALEGGSSLSEGGSLLLKLSVCLLAHVLLLLKLLLRRGERSSLVRQAGPQQLDLLSLLLGLALPGPCPLKGSTFLLELSSGGSQLPLEFRCRNPHRGRILTRLPQRLVPLQERCPHLRDCGDVFCSLGVLLQELVLHSAQPVLQPPAVGSQGFDESVQSVILVPIPVALGAQLIEAIIPLLSTTLKLLSMVNETREKVGSENARVRKRKGKSRIRRREHVP